MSLPSRNLMCSETGRVFTLKNCLNTILPQLSLKLSFHSAKLPTKERERGRERKGERKRKKGKERNKKKERKRDKEEERKKKREERHELFRKSKLNLGNKIFLPLFYLST